MAPSLAANIGSTVRAMTTMGLRDLMVVSPQDPDFREHPDARARAGRAEARLSAVRSCDTLDEALADCQLAVAVSAEGRRHGPAPEFPLPLCAEVIEAVGGGGLARVAFVFGTERTGLSVEQMARCQRWLAIPADTGYNSLNLSQAVQIVAFSLRQCVLAQQSVGGGLPAQAFGPAHAQTGAQAGDESGSSGAALPSPPSAVSAGGQAATPPVVPARSSQHGAGKPADLAALEGLYAHLERSLVALGTLDPARPRRLMPRLRQLLGRSGLDRDEVDMLRGVCRDIERQAGRLKADERPH